jgi:hypothetical protein
MNAPRRLGFLLVARQRNTLEIACLARADDSPPPPRQRRRHEPGLEARPTNNEPGASTPAAEARGELELGGRRERGSRSWGGEGGRVRGCCSLSLSSDGWERGAGGEPVNNGWAVWSDRMREPRGRAHVSLSTGSG